MVLGMGTGGALVNSLFRRDRPSPRSPRPSADPRLWAGDSVELDRFAVLGGALRYRAGAVAELTYAVPGPRRIVVAGVGPKILAVAGELADGLISPCNLPTRPARPW